MSIRTTSAEWVRHHFTASSPQHRLSPFELSRYLDYCSEALSLISKIAALYVQSFQDPVVLDAVDDMEDLTTGISRKVWQKITLIDQMKRNQAGEVAIPSQD